MKVTSPVFTIIQIPKYRNAQKHSPLPRKLTNDKAPKFELSVEALAMCRVSRRDGGR